MESNLSTSSRKEDYTIDRYQILSKHFPQDSSSYLSSRYSDIGSFLIYNYLIFDFGAVNDDCVRLLKMTENIM